MINESNIYAFWDKFESGQLSEEEQTIFLNYLDQLSDQKQNKGDLIHLDSSFKDSLKKPQFITPENFQIVGENQEELFLVAALENQLTSDEKVYFENKIKTDEIFREKFIQFQKALLAKEITLFPGKNKLKKQPFIKLSRVSWISFAAATVTLAFFLFYKTNDAIKNDVSKQLVANKLTENKIENTNCIKKIKYKTDTHKKLIENNEYLYIKEIHNKQDSSKQNVFPELDKNLSLNSDKYIQSDTIFYRSELLGKLLDSLVSKNQSESFTQINLPISESENTINLSWKQFLKNQFNKLIYKKTRPDMQDKVDVFTNVFTNATGIDMKLILDKENRENARISRFSMGSFSYEHK